MELSKKKVSITFRQEVIGMFPILKHNSAYMRMMEYLLFGTFIDKDTKQLIISQEIIARIEDKVLNDRYVAETFLEAFKHDVLSNFVWSAWSIDKARQVINNGFTKELEQLRINELFTQHAEYVYFVDGDKPSKAKNKLEREYFRMNALNNIERTETADAKELLEYMNNIPPNKFTKTVNDYINDAYAVAARLNAKPATIQQQLSLLRTIEDVVQPFYQSSKEQRTVRIFGMNESMLMLKKEVRKALTKDWIDLDLKSAHLAIFAYLFDIREVNEFLVSGENIWDSLFEHFNLPYVAEIKKLFKEALYSVIYGMPVSNIKGNLSRELNKIRVFDAGDIFVSHPVIAALIAARNKAMKDIEINKGAMTVYGKWLSTDKYSIESILSQLSQAVELQVLMPALRLAANNKKHITITLWQHDGFSISITDNKEYWVRRIQKVIRDEVNRIGINTELVVDV